jgi:hypothetical protein
VWCGVWCGVCVVCVCGVCVVWCVCVCVCVTMNLTDGTATLNIFVIYIVTQCVERSDN